MGDMAEGFRELRRISQEQRSHNRQSGRQRLQRCGVKFETRNDGAHLIVNHNGKAVDYWPGTGKWISRADRTRRGRGISQLLRFLGVQAQEDPHENSITSRDGKP